MILRWFFIFILTVLAWYISNFCNGACKIAFGLNECIYVGFQEDMVHYLHKSTGLWSISGGRDHVIPMHHPNAFRFFREQINTSIHIVGDSERYPQILGKDVLAPCVPLVDSIKDEISSEPFESRTMLLFFLGQKNRKDVCYSTWVMSISYFWCNLVSKRSLLYAVVQSKDVIQLQLNMWQNQFTNGTIVLV